MDEDIGKKVLFGGSILLGLVAIILMSATAVHCEPVVPDDPLENLSGAQVAFGYWLQYDNSLSFHILDFSFGYFMAYLLAFAGIVFAVLVIAGKLGSIGSIASSLCMLVAGVLFFCAVPLCTFAGDYAPVGDEIKEICSLGVGAIFAGILALLASILSFIPFIIDRR